MVILLVKIYGFFKWMMQDYAHVPAHVIEEESARLANEEEVQHVAASAEPAPSTAAVAAQ
ncbi:hypothetical protein D9M71_848520 [compost metagenome]